MSEFTEKLKKAKGFICMQPADEKDIVQAEQKLGLTFSEEYREYVTEYGAACIFGHELTGISKSRRLDVAEVTQTCRNDGYVLEKDMYVIEEMHIDGIILLQNGKGEVFTAKKGLQPRRIAGSFTEYLKL